MIPISKYIPFFLKFPNVFLVHSIKFYVEERACLDKI